MAETYALDRTGPTPDPRGDITLATGDDRIARAQAGDNAAFEALVREHERNVYRVAWRVLGNAEDARDVAQDVFIRLFRHLQRFDASRPLAPWLYRMTVNACRDHVRRWRLDRLETIQVRTTTPSFAHSLELREEQEIVLAGLATLTPAERAAIVLRDIEGLSTREVATAVGSRETTVRSLISRARVKLKQYRDKAMGI